MDKKDSTSKEIIDINMGMGYPVKWSKYQVFRDYIQNFYDAVGYEKFHRCFQYEYEEKTLIMYAHEIPFHLDWLQVMGASTKRTGETLNVGQFGEGFKVASLCAYRDHHYAITMESMRWRINVAEKKRRIDGRDVNMLCYEKGMRQDDGKTILTLTGVSESDMEIFVGELESFYFPENSRFGELLEKGKEYAVYKLSDKCKNNMGFVYASLVNRGRIRFPLIFCNHLYKEDYDRDREALSEYHIRKCILEIVAKLNASTCLLVMEEMRALWYRPADKKMDWTDIIKSLIKKIQQDNEVRTLFIEKYQNVLLVDNAIHSGYSAAYRSIAHGWVQSTDKYRKCRYVCDLFTTLGINTLEEVCRQNNGFVVCRKPNAEEERYIQVLEKAAVDVFGDLLQYDSLPEVSIITNKQVAVHGLARGKKRVGARNRYGLKVVSDIREINIREEEVVKEGFGLALAVYLHELLHQYGGDSSLQFHMALLIMNRRISESYSCIEKYMKEWKALGA